MARYIYLGDRLTDPKYVGQPCDPVLRRDRRPVTVIVGRRPRNQLVRFADGELVVVLGRRLRVSRQVLVLDDFPSPWVARVLSPNGRAHWKDRLAAGGVVAEHVAAAIAIQNIRPMTGRVRILPTFVMPVRRRRDDDNYATGVMKVVRDALVARGILADDSTLHVRQEPVEVVVIRGQRHLKIVIETMPPAAVPAALDGAPEV